MIANWEQFFDRQLILERIVQGICAPAPASFALVGAPLIGKSALLRHLASAQGPLRAALSGEIADHKDVSSILVLLDGAHIASVEELAARWELATEPAAQSPVEHHTHDGKPALRSVLLLDNLDRLLTLCTTPSSIFTWLTRLAISTPVLVTTTQHLYDLNGAVPDAHLHTFTPLFLGSIDQDAANRWLAVYTAHWPQLATSVEALHDLTGRHPFLLQRLGDSLDEVQQMLASGSGTAPAVDSLPFIRLRLAEYGRPLFASLLNCIQHAPLAVDRTQLWLVLKELVRGPIALAQITQEALPALNWLINQAAVLYGEYKHALGYRLFSPLFADFLARHLTAPAMHTAPEMAIGYNAQGQAALYEQLTKMEASLLRYLQNHDHMVVSTEQLLADVWKRPNASTRRVQEAIRRLRLQLQRHSPPIGEIRNERGRGYRFVSHAHASQTLNKRA